MEPTRATGQQTNPTNGLISILVVRWGKDMSRKNPIVGSGELMAGVRNIPRANPVPYCREIGTGSDLCASSGTRMVDLTYESRPWVCTWGIHVLQRVVRTRPSKHHRAVWTSVTISALGKICGAVFWPDITTSMEWSITCSQVDTSAQTRVYAWFQNRKRQ